MSPKRMLTKSHTLKPGEYTIKEFVFTADYVVPTTGPLVGRVFYIQAPVSTALEPILLEKATISINHYEERAWWRPWLKKVRIMLSDGRFSCSVVESSADEYPL